MKTYTVTGSAYVMVSATVEAQTESEALEKAGDLYLNDWEIDSSYPESPVDIEFAEEN